MEDEELAEQCIRRTLPTATLCTPPFMLNRTSGSAVRASSAWSTAVGRAILNQRYLTLWVEYLLRKCMTLCCLLSVPIIVFGSILTRACHLENYKVFPVVSMYCFKLPSYG